MIALIARCILTTCVVVAGGCLLPGCFIPISAERMAGYYAPSAKAEKNAWGASIELGTSFVGSASYNAETGSYEVTVDSKPEPVLEAQAVRATALENLRQIEAEANVRIAEAWSQAMVQSIGALSSALQLVAQQTPPAGPPDPSSRELLTPDNARMLLDSLGRISGARAEPNPQ